MQSTVILLQCQLLNSESNVLQGYNVLFSPSSTLCQTGFPVCWFFIRFCFLGRFIWSKSPLLSLLSLIFRLSIYNCHHPIQHHFLSIAILSSESPATVYPVHFVFLFCCVNVLKL